MFRKYTMITGASSGIGRETAKQFAERGSSLILSARRQEKLADLADELCRRHPGIRVATIPADLSVPGEAERLYACAQPYPVTTWINNAGRGFYGSAASQAPADLQSMLQLNVQSLAVLSTLYVRDHFATPGAQLINVSSCGGYVNVPSAVSYCGAKFFVSAFTEGLAAELRSHGAKLQAKVFAPAATQTGFGPAASMDPHYDYRKVFPRFHTAAEAARMLMALYDSGAVVGLVDRNDFSYALSGPRFPCASGC